MEHRISSLAGLSLFTEVSDIPQVRVQVLSRSGDRHIEVVALIDSGADLTCVADDVMTELGYPPVREIVLVSASGRNTRNAYMGMLRFPSLVPVYRADLEIGGLPELGQQGRPAMLLGRDVLEHGSFCWDGRSRTTTLRFGQ
jgi:hypothetical protein